MTFVRISPKIIQTARKASREKAEVARKILSGHSEINNGTSATSEAVTTNTRNKGRNALVRN